jgi:hypothetical protein
MRNAPFFNQSINKEASFHIAKYAKREAVGMMRADPDEIRMWILYWGY